MSGHEDFARRGLRAGDETVLAALAERAYSPYGGHVLRTAEHWHSSLLAARARFGPESDIVVLTRGGGDPVGYGVLGADGLVLELCLDPDLTGARRAVAAAVLIAALEEQARTRGVEQIELELPRLDGRLREALAAAGYRAEAGSQLAVDMVDVAGALKGILAHRQSRMPHGWERCFVIALSAGGDSAIHDARLPSLLRVTASDGALAVEEMDGPAAPGGAGGERTVAIAMDRATLTGLILRRITFDEAAATGLISLEPADAEQDVRTLCEFLALKGPWFMPPLDRRQGNGVLSLKLEPGITFPCRFTHRLGDGDGSPRGRDNQRHGVVFRVTAVGDVSSERSAVDAQLHRFVIGPGVGIRYRRILGPKPLGPQVAAWGERMLRRPGIRARLTEPLRLQIESADLPAFRCVLTATGFRLEPGPDGGADAKVRVPYAWLNGSWPDTGAVLRAWARGRFQLHPRPRAWGRVLALALAFARFRR